MREKIESHISVWEGRGYPQGIPDSAPQRLEGAGRVPSYRRICKAILKNDVALLSLGYSRPNCEAYNTIKRIEIAARKK